MEGTSGIGVQNGGTCQQGVMRHPHLASGSSTPGFDNGWKSILRALGVSLSASLGVSSEKPSQIAFSTNPGTRVADLGDASATATPDVGIVTHNSLLGKDPPSTSSVPVGASVGSQRAANTGLVQNAVIPMWQRGLLMSPEPTPSAEHLKIALQQAASTQAHPKDRSHKQIDDERSPKPAEVAQLPGSPVGIGELTFVTSAVPDPHQSQVDVVVQSDLKAETVPTKRERVAESPVSPPHGESRLSADHAPIESVPHIDGFRQQTGLTSPAVSTDLADEAAHSEPELSITSSDTHPLPAAAPQASRTDLYPQNSVFPPQSVREPQGHAGTIADSERPSAIPAKSARSEALASPTLPVPDKSSHEKSKSAASATPPSPRIDIHPASVSDRSEAGLAATHRPDLDNPSIDSSSRPAWNAQQTFSALDTDASQPGARWLHVSPHRAEAGFEDASLGWVSIRAQSDSAGVHAAIIPSSSDAARALSAHLPELNAHISSHYAHVHPVTLFSASCDGDSAGMAGGSAQDERRGSDRSNEQQPARDPGSVHKNTVSPNSATGELGEGRGSPLASISAYRDGRHVSVIA